MMQLQIDGDPGQVVWLRRPNYLIGRSSVCNLRFRDADLELVHAHLKVREGVVTLVGQDSAPVEVNGVRVKKETRLNHGDRVALGKVKLAILNPEQDKREAEGSSEKAGHPKSGQPQSDEPDETMITVRVDAHEEEAEQEAPEASWVLHGLSSGLAGKRFTVSGNMVVGRGQACEIRLAEAHLSRCHARLTNNGDSLVVEDLKSSNGTFVNGRRVNHARLKNGDELSLDTVKFRILHVAAEEDSDATMLHGVEGQQKPTRPAGPTAIDIQRANLRRMRDDTAGHTAVEAFGGRSPGPRVVGGGWITLTVIVVLAGALWGAKSFLGAPFLG